MSYKKGDVLFAILFGGCFLALGLLCLKWSVPDLWVGLRSYTWPDTGGAITFVREDGHLPPEKKANKPALLYSYEIEGKQYLAGRIAYNSMTRRSDRAARRLAEHYHVGQDVTVYYNPRDPRYAALKKGVGLVLLIPLIFGLSGLFLSGLILLGTFLPAPHERLRQQT